MSSSGLSERDFLAMVVSGNVPDLKKQTKKMEKKKLFLLVNMIARKGRTPLHIACERSSLELIEFLLISGANINALDSNGWSPLAVSAKEKDLAACSLLLRSGADPNLHTFGSETTALHQLVRIHPFNEEVEAVLELMLKQGAQIDAKNAEGETPLDYVVTKSNVRALGFLLTHGANPNSPNLAGNGTLHIAVLIAMKNSSTQHQTEGDATNIKRKKKKQHSMETQRSIIQTLLRFGADPMMKGSHGSAFDLLEIDPLSSLPIRDLFYTDDGDRRTNFSLEKATNSTPKSDSTKALTQLEDSAPQEKSLSNSSNSSETTRVSEYEAMFIEQPDGYRIEEGTCANPSPHTYRLDLFIYRQLYCDNFYKKKHINLVGYTWSDESEPMIASVKDTPEPDKRYMGLIRTKYDGQRQIFIEPSEINVKKKFVKEVSNYLCNVFFLGSSLLHVKDPSIEDALKSLETSDPERKRTLAFGVVYGKGEQTKGIEFYENQSGSNEFENFLKVLGTRIELSSWTGFRGGLGYEAERHSIFTVWGEFDIMFHVSTLLPYDPLDPGKLGRANKIGNDVCVIIFHEGNVPLSPDCITSNVCQVFIMVRPITIEGKHCYRVAVARKKDVPYFEPEVPVILHSESELRHFLLMKTINGQIAAQRSTLGKMFVTPRKAKVEEIVHRYYPPDKLKPAKKNSLVV